MQYFTTQQAARNLGIGLSTLIRHIVNDKVPAPKSTKIGKREVRAWTEKDIERVRELLPKIENGRKTRYQKEQQSALSTQQSAKAKSKAKPKSSSRKRKPSGSKP